MIRSVSIPALVLSFAVTLLVGYAAGCHSKGYDLDQASLVAVEQAETRARIAEREAFRASDAADSLRQDAEELRNVIDELSTELLAKEGALRAARREAEEASVSAETLRLRFEDTGTPEDCRDALSACTSARIGFARALARADTLIIQQREVIEVRGRQVLRLESAYDSLRVAFSLGQTALDEQRTATNAALGLAAKYRWERNAVVVSGLVVIGGVIYLAAH